jgi:hypothetical protein
MARNKITKYKLQTALSGLIKDAILCPSPKALTDNVRRTHIPLTINN